MHQLQLTMLTGLPHPRRRLPWPQRVDPAMVLLPQQVSRGRVIADAVPISDSLCDTISGPFLEQPLHKSMAILLQDLLHIDKRHDRVSDASSVCEN